MFYKTACLRLFSTSRCPTFQENRTTVTGYMLQAPWAARPQTLLLLFSRDNEFSLIWGFFELISFLCLDHKVITSSCMLGRIQLVIRVSGQSWRLWSMFTGPSRPEVYVTDGSVCNNREITLGNVEGSLNFEDEAEGRYPSGENETEVVTLSDVELSSVQKWNLMFVSVSFWVCWNQNMWLLFFPYSGNVSQQVPQAVSVATGGSYINRDKITLGNVTGDVNFSVKVTSGQERAGNIFMVSCRMFAQ